STRRSEYGGCLNQQEGAQAFAAIQRRVAHGRDKARRAKYLTPERRVVEELFEEDFDIGSDRSQPGEDIAIILVHRGVVCRCTPFPKVGRRTGCRIGSSSPVIQSGKQRGFTHVMSRALRGAVLALLVMVLLPYLITPLYSVIDPISTMMLSRQLSGARVERHF